MSWPGPAPPPTPTQNGLSFTTAAQPASRWPTGRLAPQTALHQSPLAAPSPPAVTLCLSARRTQALRTWQPARFTLVRFPIPANSSPCAMHPVRQWIPPMPTAADGQLAVQPSTAAICPREEGSGKKSAQAIVSRLCLCYKTIDISNLLLRQPKNLLINILL